MDWSGMFYGDWTHLVRTLIVGTLAYGALVVSLRASGKRTLAKLNAFDLVVTVAFGSMLATILLSQDVSLARGVTGLVLLILLQYAVAYASLRSPRFARLVRSEPTILARHGQTLPDAMRRERVTETELESVLRTHGFAGWAEVGAVILESDGSFSVLPSRAEENRKAPS